MTGWLIALGAVVLLAILPLGISLRYDAGGARARMIFGPVKIRLYPGKPKANKRGKANKKEQKEKKPSSKKAQKQGGNLSDFLPLLRAILDLLTEFRRKLRVNRLEVRFILAGEDPCDLAVNYGKAWAVISGLMPQLERFFVIKHRDVGVSCDFVSGETRVIAALDVTITLARLLSLGLRHGLHCLLEFQKVMNKRKGGAKI